MKKLILIGLLLLISNIGYAEFLGIKKSSETVSFFLKPPLDSLYGIQRKPDSVHIFTYADNATAHTYAARSTTYPFSDISIDTLKHFSDTVYVFADAIADIDGAGGHFTLAINVYMYYDKIPTHTYATVQIISDSLNIALVDATKALDSLADLLDSAETMSTWIQDSLYAVLDSIQDVMGVDIVAISGDADVADSLEAGLDGYADAQSTNREQLYHLEADIQGISISGTNLSAWADSVNLTDGTETNTYASTHVLDGTYYEVAEGGTGTNLNINYYLIFDIGVNRAPVKVIYYGRLDEGSAPSGGDAIDVWAYDWTGTSWTHISAPLIGNIIGIFGSTPADDELYESGLIGGDFVSSTGKVRISFSNYDPDGAAGSDLEENTELLLDQVFIEYQSTITVNDIWEYDSANVSGAAAMGTVLKDNTDTVNVMIKYFDTLIYQGCVWVDAGANTNTVIGVDGVPSNPVSTMSAAKTIADNLGIGRICLMDGITLSITETMEHYIICGQTRSATINMNGQDVDGSFFTNLTVTGEQGGTGLIVVTNSGLSNADSLEIHARNCAIIGNLSLRAGDNFFDKCYSSVAGNATPVLDFNDVNTTVNVSWRAYSGGLEVQNMTTDHTMSYETDGQLVVNANSDNANITIRGMCSITDNGTDMNITKDAVFNRAEVSTPIIDTVNGIIDTFQIKYGDREGGWANDYDAKLKSLVISNNAGDAMQLTSTGSNGDGLQVDGDGTGSGLYAVGGATGSGIRTQGQGSGSGLQADGGATGDGINAQGQGSGSGLQASGGATGDGINAIGNGTGDGMKLLGGLAGNGDGMDIQGTGTGFDIKLTGTNKVISDGTNTVLMTDDYALMAVVEDSSGNTTTMLQTNLAEATDNHYNGMMVHFIDGTEAITARRITDYDGGNGYIVFDPALITAPAAGDSIRIKDWASVSASATISDADMGAIADSVHDKDTTDAFAVASGFGKFVKDSTQGSAAGLTKEDVADAVMDSLGAGTRPIEITRLWVAATGNDAAVKFTGSGTGSGIEILSGATASYSLYCASAATNGQGMHILGKGTSPGLQIKGGTSAGGDGVHFVAGTGSNGHGLNLKGNGTGFDMRLETSGSISDGTNTVLMTSDIPITPTDTTESGYSIVCSGIGPRTVRIYAVDSAGTDSVMTGINIEVKDQNDNRYVYNRTNTSGHIQFNATENDTFLVYGFGEPAHTFPGDTASAGAPATIGHDSIFVTVGGDITDTIWAYDNNVAAPGSADLSRVYYDVFDLVGQPMYKKTQMVVELFNNNRVMRDTCNNTSIGTYVAEGAKANSAGRIEIDLRKSKCYDDPNIVYHAYLQIGGRRGVKLDIGDFKVRDSVSQMLKVEDD